SSQFRCSKCNRDFKFAGALEAQLKEKIHPSRQTVLQPPPNTCTICNKTFRSANSLASHTASRVHKPISQKLSCLRPGCKKKFNSPSAMIHHLESGSCSHDINKDMVNKVITENDHTGIITNSAARTGLESWHRAQRSGILSPLEPGELTPTSSLDTAQDTLIGMQTPVEGPNPSALFSQLMLVFPLNTHHRCPLCPRNRDFRTKRRLETHLQSSAHAPRIYHCPVSLFDTSQLNHFRSFTTLSGLVQHLESEACNCGRSTFEKVIRFVGERLNDMGLDGLLMMPAERETGQSAINRPRESSRGHF
ncbi:hypothetical protein BDZ91DRAFT_669775, partial [Kalaharituber pfeilii]